MRCVDPVVVGDVAPSISILVVLAGVLTGKELKAALRTLEWAQAELGRRIAVRPNSVSRWIADRDAEVPGPVAAYVRLALKVKLLSMEVTGGR